MPEINAISTNGITYDIVDKTALHDGSNYKTKQSAKTDPSASGTSTSFITTLSQNANGVISASKANLESYKATQTAVSNPSASGTTNSFIKTITQNTNGVITATKANMPHAAYITATGTSNSWTYRKWSNGTYECWKTVDTSISSSSWVAWNGVYTSSTFIPQQTFPVTFSAVPYVNAVAVPNNDLYGFWLMSGAQANNQATTTKTGKYQPCRGATATGTATYTVQFYVKGKV